MKHIIIFWIKHSYKIVDLFLLLWYIRAKFIKLKIHEIIHRHHLRFFLLDDTYILPSKDNL